MKKITLALVLALALSMALTACAPGGAESQSVQPSQSVSASISEAAEPKEITNIEQVRGLYGEEYVIETATCYENGWLVEYYPRVDSDIRSLDWVFPSGWRTHISSFPQILQYEVDGTGRVIAYTSGENFAIGGRYMPTKTTFLPGEGVKECDGQEEIVFLPLAQEWRFGRDDQAEVLYQVRLGLTGVECAFISPVDTLENVIHFHVAATYIPAVETSFDEDEREFSIRMLNTSLSSGEIAQEIKENSDTDAWYNLLIKDLYPHSMPEGVLGDNSRWITDAQLTQDGKDALITLTLAPDVVGYRLEADNLGNDDMPYFRLEFTRNDRYLFPAEYLLN